jgi:hypothetical protein
MRSKKIRHTIHSRQRALERADGEMREIQNKLKHRRYIGLPRQTVNRRVAAMKIGDKWIVVIHMKSSSRIITVLTLEQYMKNHHVPDYIMEKIKLAD